MLVVPIAGIIVGLIIYFYMRSVYRKVVKEVDFPDTMKWMDKDAFKPTIFKQLPLPVYFADIEKAGESFTFHE